MLEKAPLGADQVAEDALPVRVPTTVIEPLEQTDCVAEGTVTPLKLLTLTTRLSEAMLLPQGLLAITEILLLPNVAFVATLTVI